MEGQTIIGLFFFFPLKKKNNPESTFCGLFVVFFYAYFARCSNLPVIVKEWQPSICTSWYSVRFQVVLVGCSFKTVQFPLVFCKC